MIVDCFPFFNELDLLEIRLHELAPVVDKFVLCEATLTHSGKPKPLTFADHKDRFKDFPIEHMVLDAYYGVDKADAWGMEHYHRDVVVNRAATQFALNDDDVILMSDCDEIPKASAVTWFCESGLTRATLGMEMYYYYFNLRRIAKVWPYAKIFRPLTIPIDTNAIRRAKKRKPRIEDAGWHFSYLGGVEGIRQKLDAFAHREDSIQKWNTAENIGEQLAKCQDPFHRNKYQFALVDGTSFLPQYVQDNLARFQGMLCASP